MLRRFSVYYLTAFLLASLTGCAARDPNFSGLRLEQKIDRQGGLESAPAMAVVGKNLLTLYVDEKGHLNFRRNESTPVRLDSDLPEGGWSYLQIQVRGENVYAAWWTHNKKKTLYFDRSDNGGKSFSKPVEVTASKEVLPPYVFRVGKNGEIGFLYTDERSGSHGLYYKLSKNGGGSWEPGDFRVDVPPGGDVKYLGTSHPQLTAAGDKWIAAWIQGVSEGAQQEYSVNIRYSDDQGETWSQPVTIFKSDRFIGGLAGVSLSESAAVVFDTAGEGIRVATANSGDLKKWRVSKPLPNTNLTTNSGLAVAVDKTNNKIYMTWIEQQPDVKPWIMAGAWDEGGQKWVSDPAKLDEKAFNITTSTLPTIAVNDEGIPLVAWIDYRNILPNIYVSASFDGGVHWSKNQNIEENGLFTSFYPQVIPDGRDYLIGYQHFYGRDKNYRDFIVRELVLEKPLGVEGLPKSKVIAPKEKEEKLYKRVNEFWQDRVSGRFAQTYEFYDPGFRSVYDKNTFDETQGHVKYFSAKLKGCTINENIANCVTEIEAKLLPFQYMGRTLESQRKKSEAPQTWVWIRDNWYLVFKNPMGGSLLMY